MHQHKSKGRSQGMKKLNRLFKLKKKDSVVKVLRCSPSGYDVDFYCRDPGSSSGGGNLFFAFFCVVIHNGLINRIFA